jgi:hypothetical protein
MDIHYAPVPPAVETGYLREHLHRAECQDHGNTLIRDPNDRWQQVHHRDRHQQGYCAHPRGSLHIELVAPLPRHPAARLRPDSSPGVRLALPHPTSRRRIRRLDQPGGPR